MKITVDYLKDKVHEQSLELQDLRKSYDELTKSALRLDKMVKEKQEEIDQLKLREKEHQRLNGELREEIERLNNIINELENENEKLYNLCETNNICYLQGLEDSEKINDFKYSDFVKKWLKDTKEKLQRGDIYEQSNNDRKE